MRARVARVALTASLAASLAAAGAASLAPAARADEAHDLARRLVALSGGTDGVEKVMSLMRGSLVRRIEAGSGKTEAAAAAIVDGTVMPSVRAALPAIQAMVVEVEVRAYGLDELRGLVAFYASPVGREMVAKQPQLVATIVPAAMAIAEDRLRRTLRDRADDLRKQGVSL